VGYDVYADVSFYIQSSPLCFLDTSKQALSTLFSESSLSVAPPSGEGDLDSESFDRRYPKDNIALKALVSCFSTVTARAVKAH
jgi:hypothetical protein